MTAGSPSRANARAAGPESAEAPQSLAIAHQPARYYPSLDGLRAVAVLPVVLYHAGADWLPGGFVGVDIFFVLSGFFITRQLVADLEDRRFSVLTFYERRARRILPALFCMLGGLGLVACFVLFPDALERLGETTLATLGFASNIYLWRSSLNYFEPEASYNLLLHTWSLAVEEQFYLFFPLVLAAIWRVTHRHAATVLALLGLVSFVICVVATSRAPSASFYLLPTRAWELLIGAFIATAPTRRLPDRLLDALSLGGLALIAWALVFITEGDGFPGWRAAIPVIGSALLVRAAVDEGGIGNRLLTARPLVFVGLISYSLYLWHWPLLALARRQAFGNPGLGVNAAMVGLAFVLAVLSWRFVERPFRGSRSPVSRRAVVVFSAAGISALAALCGVLMFTGGLPGRLEPNVLAMLRHEPDALTTRCFGRTAEDVAAHRTCLIGQSRVAPSIAVWGDSHASRIAQNVDRFGRRTGLSAWYASTGSCPPVLGVEGPAVSLDCKAFNAAVSDRLRTDGTQVVVMSANWAAYAEGSLLSREHQFAALSAAERVSVNPKDNRRVFRDHLLQTLAVLREASKNVVLVGPIPELPWSAPERLAAALVRGERAPTGLPTADFLRREEGVLSALAEAERQPGVTVVYPHLVLCGAEHCAVAHEDKRLYFDDNHIDTEGNRLLAPALETAMQRALNEAPTGMKSGQ